MGAPYGGTTVSGYNSNPPPDDGTTVSLNQLQWNRDIKGKIGDPLNTFASAVNTNVTNAFNKTISGGSVVKTAVNYGASAADQGRNIVATAANITVTTPDATSVLSPFVWAVNNQSTGTITVAGFSAQTVDGNNTSTLGAGRGIILWTDGSNWFSSGLVMGNLPTVNPPFGFDAPLNLQLNASVGSNLLTIAVKANNGNDPSASNPVLIPFRDNTAANGDPVWVAVTSALSINTNATGASLGTVNSVAFRLWVLCFNNSGTPVLALFQSVTGGAAPTSIAPLNESQIVSTTGISAAATSAGTFYTPNGTTLSNKSFRILGYVDYVSGLATAGTYSSAPTIVQLFGPGIKKPGDIIQSTNGSFTSTTASSTTSYIATTMQVNIIPTSNCNIIRVKALASLTNNTDGNWGTTRISRGTTSNTNLFGNDAASAAPAIGTGGSVFNYGWDLPQTTSTQTYTLQIKAINGQVTLAFNQFMETEEIQV